MARRDVVELQCDRCGRLDLQPPEQPLKEGQRELAVDFRGRRIVFSDLCRNCRKVVENYLNHLELDKERPDIVLVKVKA